MTKSISCKARLNIDAGEIFQIKYMSSGVRCSAEGGSGVSQAAGKQAAGQTGKEL